MEKKPEEQQKKNQINTQPRRELHEQLHDYSICCSTMEYLWNTNIINKINIGRKKNIGKLIITMMMMMMIGN